MIYRVRHVTSYEYQDPVSISHHVLKLTPRKLVNQFIHGTGIFIVPAPPTGAGSHHDYFGNPVTSFTLQELHGHLSVEACSELEVVPRAQPDLGRSAPWETVRDVFATDHSPAALQAYQYVFESQRISTKPALADYCRESFAPGRPILEGALDLTTRINRDFQFDTKATEVTTSVNTFFECRRGVCQDFAHLQIACLRSLGLPARYVSGYLRTLPPPGKPRLVGADASHAWCAAWSPDSGWVDFDPTNNCIPSDGHITVAWGRDYTDICPIHGVLLGGAHHTLHVSVDVLPLS